jgi:hypothetical protein
MLDRAKRPLWSDGSRSAVHGPAREPHGGDPRERPHALDAPDSGPDAGRGTFRQPRVAAVLMLILAGVVWALVRGLEFFGVSPVNLVYDLDQPPLLLIFVAAWLLYRSRRR